MYFMAHVILTWLLPLHHRSEVGASRGSAVYVPEGSGLLTAGWLRSLVSVYQLYPDLFCHPVAL